MSFLHVSNANFCASQAAVVRNVRPKQCCLGARRRRPNLHRSITLRARSEPSRLSCLVVPSNCMNFLLSTSVSVKNESDCQCSAKQKCHHGQPQCCPYLPLSCSCPLSLFVRHPCYILSLTLPPHPSATPSLVRLLSEPPVLDSPCSILSFPASLHSAFDICGGIEISWGRE